MEKSSNKTLNKNREIKIDKLILNISVGNQQVFFIHFLNNTNNFPTFPVLKFLTVLFPLRNIY